MISHLWQSTFFAAAAWLVTLSLRHNRARVRYWVWLIASIKFLLPFVLLVNAGRQLRPEWAPAALRVTGSSAMVAFERIGIREMSAQAGRPAPRKPKSDWIPATMAAIWACGFLGVAAIRLRGWHRVRAAVRSSVPMGRMETVEVRTAPGWLEPGVVGWLRPVLLMPEGIADRLTAPQLEAVLAHELCHVRRRDNLSSSIHMMVEAIFWFHPLVWWIGARLVEERELACDESVLSMGSAPRDYADAILNVCKWYVESPVVCVAGVTGANLKQRIEAIMTNQTAQTLNRAKRMILAAAGVVALTGPVAIGVLIGAGHAPIARAQSRAAAPVAQMAQAAAPTPAPAPQTGRSAGERPPDRRLVAMLFDYDSMTAAEQARAQQSAIEFVRTNMRPGDVVSVLSAEGGKVTVAQDFTNDHAVLESAISKHSAADGTLAGAGPRVSSLEAAARLLGAIPEKKGLMYFSSGVSPWAGDHASEMQSAIQAAQKANIAIYVIDARGTAGAAAAPAAYEGLGEVAGALVESLDREGRDRVVDAVAGLPGRHASMLIFASPSRAVLTVPMDAFEGRVDVIGEVVASMDGKSVANVRDSSHAPAGVWQSGFVLPAGSYVCHVVVREKGTGRTFGETIRFEVK